MSTGIGSTKLLNDFERIMEQDLLNLVKTTDCEKGIQLLVETLKKQHVNNFAMQQSLMTSMNRKTEVENWKTGLVTQTRRA